MTPAIKALFFDVFGTLVDWRTSIAREAKALLEPRGYALDWLAFADAWRGEYQGAMEEVRAGSIAFCKLDVLHRRNLDVIVPRVIPKLHVKTPSDELSRRIIAKRLARPFAGIRSMFSRVRGRSAVEFRSASGLACPGTAV